MSLEELIQVLETAREQATEGRVGAASIGSRDGRWDDHIIDSDGRFVANCGFTGSSHAQAIATRHNTAGEVLRHLEMLRVGRPDTLLECELAGVKMACDEFRTRAEKAEDRVAELESGIRGIARELSMAETLDCDRIADQASIRITHQVEMRVESEARVAELERRVAQHEVVSKIIEISSDQSGEGSHGT